MPRSRKPRRQTAANSAREDLPPFCDYACPNAGFAPAEMSGACRREQAVYCGLFETFNTKNNACLGKLIPARARKQ
jgi:hypothetical protein